MAENSSMTQKGRAEQTISESTRGAMYFTPRVDIYENDKELTLYADVPGVRPEDLDMRYERGQLFLHARVPARPQQPNYLLAEYEEGDFYRVFDIHESIDAGKIEAECKNGVLTVHLPKVEAARPRQITVRGK
jgi:HSP20 family protein